MRRAAGLTSAVPKGLACAATLPAGRKAVKGLSVVLVTVGNATQPFSRLLEAVDRLIGEGRDTRLRPEGQGEAEIFGAAAGLVRSDALIRIKVSAEAPVGLIAFGSRRESTFHPSQGTELLAFLARALEISVRSWLRSPT